MYDVPEYNHILTDSFICVSTVRVLKYFYNARMCVKCFNKIVYIYYQQIAHLIILVILQYFAA
jgi:hypothetical protein